jgi:hypothetical protein
MNGCVPRRRSCKIYPFCIVETSGAFSVGLDGERGHGTRPVEVDVRVEELPMKLIHGRACWPRCKGIRRPIKKPGRQAKMLS